MSLDKLDNGEITLSEIEKWKRKVVILISKQIERLNYGF